MIKDIAAFVMILIIGSISPVLASEMEKSKSLSHEEEGDNYEKLHKEFVDKVNNLDNFSSDEKKEMIEFLDESKKTKFTKFYMANGGLNGEMTELFTTFPDQKTSEPVDLEGEKLVPRDIWYFTHSPFLLAYQERYKTYQDIVQKKMDEILKRKKDISIAAIAGGTFYEVTNLTFPKEAILTLHDYDLDEKTLLVAEKNIKKKNLNEVAQVFAKDAWKDLNQSYDIITCNGFLFYIGEDEKVISLFENFKKHLNPGGIIVANFITPKTDWQLKEDDYPALKFLMRVAQIRPSQWSKFRSADQMINLVEKAGFPKESVQIKYDSRHIHPTLIIDTNASKE